MINNVDRQNSGRSKHEEPQIFPAAFDTYKAPSPFLGPHITVVQEQLSTAFFSIPTRFSRHSTRSTTREMYLAGVFAILTAQAVLCKPVPQTTIAPDGYWVAEIFQSGCAISDDNPRYTFNGQEAQGCTSIQGYGYRSINFDDSTSKWAVNVFTDLDCTVSLVSNIQDNQCISTLEGQFVTAFSITPR